MRPLIPEAGANMIGLIDIHDEDSSITDLSRSRCLGNHFNDVVNPIIVGGNFDHRFGQKCDLVFQTAINRRLPFLVAVPANFGNGKPGGHALESVNEIIELFRPDDALDQFHGCELCH